MSRTVSLAIAFSALGLLLGPAGAARADVIRLKTGETIKGRIVGEKTNEQVLVVEDYLSGGVRELSWGVLSGEDEARIKNGLGLAAIGDQTMPCDVVTYRLDDGTETSVRGKVVGEDQGFVLLRNRAAKEPLRVPKARIVSRDTGECDPQEVYPPDELAEMKKAEINPQDSRGWLRYAQYCEVVGAYPQAKEAYETAASDETFLNRKLAQDGAARVAAIIKDAEAVATLNDLRIALGSQLWKRVRDGIAGFPTKHPDASDPVKKKLDQLNTDFVAKRTKYFAELAGRRLEPIVRNLIKKKVTPRDVAFNDIQAWIRKDAGQEAFDLLLKEMQAKDPDTTDAEVKPFFDARPKKANVWKLAKYGSGSFIVEPPKVLPKTGTRQPSQPQQGSGKGSGSGPQPTLKLPEPPTKDTWWKDAPTDVRTDFWWAVFVEKSGLYEVDPKRDRLPCVRCDGEGVITFTLSNGGSTTVLCPRCGGARFDLSVRYH